jgi:HSP20 family protein
MSNPPNPFDELTRTFERIQEQFETMARSLDDDAVGGGPVTSSVRIDLEDADGEFVLTAELPGFEKEDIDVRVTDRTLRLEAEREKTDEETDGEYIRRERRRASAVRSVSLPEAVETDDISATYNNGVLTVRLPKREPIDEGTEIEIDEE